MKSSLFATVLGILLLSLMFNAQNGSAASQSGVAFKRPIEGGSTSCVFDTTKCGAPGKHHTGIDYVPPNKKPANVLASTCGVVSSIQQNGARDHGLGNAVILKHYVIASSGRRVTSVYYTLYAHLDRIDSKLKVGRAVLRGEKLGLVGGSGYGQRNYWGRHLHFEIKTANVLHNPSTPPKKSGTYWGYTPKTASEFGYLNPANFIGGRKAVCGTPVQ